MEALARAADRELRIYMVGGTTAVLMGWRSSTIDVDLVMRPEDDALLRAIPAIKQRLQVNDVADVREMMRRGLVAGPQLLAYFEQIEPDLYRYPALDPPSFRRTVEEAARSVG